MLFPEMNQPEIDASVFSCRVTPVINHRVRALCVHPYPNHPKGCPNFNHKAGCPSDAPLFERAFDSSGVWAVWNVFDLAGHVAKMKAAHPTWSDRQLVCCLYWQPGARSKLRDKIREFMREHRGEGLHVCAVPEAMGVDVTATMRAVGIELEWPVRTRAYQIVFMARRLSVTT